MCPSKLLDDYYQIIGSISGGTCGDVLKAREKSTGRIVAAKRIKYLNPNVGFPPNSLNEIKILRTMNHKNIAHLIQVCTKDHNVYLVFDYLQYDLHGLLYSSNLHLSLQQVRCFTRQMMLGLQALHEKKVLHRDLKPANLLINVDNVLQITDFGLAVMNPPPGKAMTSKVITIWYRPPELLLGSEHYGPEIDIWSSGCIIYEMITHNVLFRAAMDSEIEQLIAIFSVCGLPDSQWPEWKNLPYSKNFLRPGDRRFANKSLRSFLDRTIPQQFSSCIPLLLKILNFNPSKRIGIDEILKDPFLASDNGELESEKLPKLNLPDSHQVLFGYTGGNDVDLPPPKRPQQPKLG